MNQEILSGKWDQIKGHVRNEWGHLSDKDLQKVKGNKDQLLGLLQEKYGYTIEAAEQKMKDFLDRIARELNVDAGEIMSKCSHSMAALEDKMKGNVFQTALIAFGVGMLANSLLRSIFSSK